MNMNDQARLLDLKSKLDRLGGRRAEAHSALDRANEAYDNAVADEERAEKEWVRLMTEIGVIK